MSFSLNSRFVRECFLGYHTKDMVYRLAFMPDGINLENYTDLFRRGEELTSDTMPSGGLIIDSAWISIPAMPRMYPKLQVSQFRYAILYNETQAGRIIGIFDLKGTANTDKANHLPVLVGTGVVSIGDYFSYSQSLFTFSIEQSYKELYENNVLIGTKVANDNLSRDILGGYHRSTHQYNLAFFTNNISQSTLNDLPYLFEVTSDITSEAYRISNIVGTYLEEDANTIGLSGDTCTTFLSIKCPYILLYNDTTKKPIALITLESSYDNSSVNYPQGFPIYLGNMFLSANKA